MNDEHPTNSTDPWESEMSREFDKRVRDLHEAPLTFENVKGKAMTIRRNRRIAVAGGVLAVAAVIVPVAVFAGDGLGRTDERPDFAPSPTQGVDPTPSEPPAGTPRDLSFLEGKTWHRTDGSTVELDTRYDGGTELGDDLLAVRQDDRARLIIDVIDSEGGVMESLDALSYPVAGADEAAAAYVDRDGDLAIYTGDGNSFSMASGFVDGDSVVAVTGDGCAAGGANCQVFISHGDGSDPESVSSEGVRVVVAPGAYKLNDVSPEGLVAAQTSFSDAGSCSSVTEPDGAPVFETCAYSFENFSPDSTYVSGTDAYRDGIGQSYVVILDAATGDEVARWDGTDGFARNWVWEDETHLLIVAYEQGEWRVHRLGVDGSTDVVLASTKGDDVTPPFVLLGAS